MSTTTNKDSDNIPQNRYSFQYFNKEFDFGVENEEGECVRKRKKPGRKSNPPSQQEKRAKNRLAQKVFRQREQQRKGEKERQRQLHDLEIQELKSKLAIAQFESRYLKGCVLHLILTCLMQTGSVPQIWPEALIIASNSHGEYKSPVFAPYGEESIENEAYQTHALLDVLLENECIKDFNQAVCASSQKGAFFSSLLNNQLSNGMASSFPAYQIPGEIIPLNTSTQEPEKVLPSKKEKNAKKSSIQQQPQYLHISSPASLSSNSSISSTQSSSQNASQLSIQESDSNSSKHMGLIIQQKPVVGVITSPPSLKTLDDLSYMPPIQALHILKLQMKLTSIIGSNLPAALIPTALQRVIPHDIRIDFIPGAAIRDRMIIYQDYYNIDECFQLLTQNVVFLGGDVRDVRQWSFAPQYTNKFWFICHVHEACEYDDSLDKERADFIINEFRE